MSLCGRPSGSIPDGRPHRMTFTTYRIDTVNSPGDGHMVAHMFRATMCTSPGKGFFTVHKAMVCVIQVCWQLARVIRTELLASRQQTCMTNTTAACTVKTPVDGQRNCPKYVEFSSKNKFEKWMRLVSFIIRIYHDARSPQIDISMCVYIYISVLSVYIYIYIHTHTHTHTRPLLNALGPIHTTRHVSVPSRNVAVL